MFIVIIIVLFGCNNDSKQPETVVADTTVMFQQDQPSEMKKMTPPLGMQNQKEDGGVSKKSAKALVVPAGEVRTVLENKDTQIVTTTAKTFVYTETDITIRKYNPGTPPVNKPPTANAGIDKSITLPVNNTSLAGSGVDVDGTISSYSWVKVTGGAATIGSPTNSTTGITGLTQGEYLFRLTVKDNGGLTASDDVKVTVNPTAPTPSTGYLALPLSGKIIAKSGQVIENLRFENMADVGIRVGDASNVIIRNCSFIKTGAEAIEMENASNVTVTNCFFFGVTTGVYALSCQTIKVDNNQFVNVRMRSIGGRGQFVQFNGVTGAGNSVSNNKGENFLGESNPEDLISMFNSSGTSSSPIAIRNNIFRGGGPSASGGGIMTGDYGGSYQIAENNVLLNPGQYGMAASAGFNIQILNNKIFAKQQPFTNNPLYVADYAPNSSCGNIIVKGNRVNWTDKSGNKNNGWNSGDCSNTTYDPNTTISESELGVPTHLIDFITAADLLKLRGK